MKRRHMIASSREKPDVPDELETKDVQVLLGTLLESGIRGRDFIAGRHADHARRFEGTLNLLKGIGWVDEKQGVLALTTNGELAARRAPNDSELRSMLTQALVNEVSPYRTMLISYFSQFKEIDSELVHRPSISVRLQESKWRNFLMDLGLVSYREPDDLYVLGEEGVDLYVWAKTHKTTISRKKFDTDRDRRAELGFRAELAILEYERTRVGQQWQHKLEHVSANNPFACYDIKSVTLTGDPVISRYIEVKAVAAGSYQFYWTASELELARVLRKKYFLYLLPTLSNSSFDLQSLGIVEDPYFSIYENSQEWTFQENVILCRKKQ